MLALSNGKESVAGHERKSRHRSSTSEIGVSADTSGGLTLEHSDDNILSDFMRLSGGDVAELAAA